MKSRSLIASLCLSASALAFGCPALAQDATQDGAEDPAIQESATLDEVVVTGSRVVSNGNSAPTPVTVLGAEQLSATAPSNLADGLAQVPQFRGSSRQGSGISPQYVTGAFLNLRGLGANRGLVLLNGRRTAPTTAAGTVDINVLPGPLFERVDIVTGGASAAYGADAVAGVVNFVLDTDFEGLKGEVNTGVSSRSDGESYKLSLAFGADITDRLHVVGSVERYDSAGITSTEDRDWDRTHYNIISNPTWPGDGRPRFLWRPGVTGTSISAGGVIVSGALAGTQFLPGGVPAPYAFGAERTATTMVGGDGGWIDRGNVQAPLETSTFFAHADYDVSDDFSLFAEAGYSETASHYNATMTALQANSSLTIYADNAFLDPVTRARLGAAPTFPLARTFYDIGFARGGTYTDTTRFAAGFNGSAGIWSYDGYVDVGVTQSRNENANATSLSRLYEAIDSVAGPGGAPICRSTLTTPGNGCVPFDVFGSGSASPTAIAYVTGDGWADTEIEQQTAGLSFRGAPFALWAGDVSFGGGVEYRKIEVETVTDPTSQMAVVQAAGSRGLPPTLAGAIGGFYAGNFRAQPTSGYEVTEAFLETLVPLAHDAPFAYAADLNAAIRYAEYSSTGGVTSWKVGLTYSPIADLRLRATRSRDVRAPNVTELFAPLQGAFSNISDPLTGGTSDVRVLTGGNPNLEPELADTSTIGMVYAPSWVENLSVSLDYYDITIEDAIGSLSGQVIVNLCQTNPAYCDFLTRLPPPANSLTAIEARSLNQSSLDTSGVDLEINYARDLDTIWSSLPGTLRLRTFVSYLEELVTTDLFGVETDAAGVNGGEVSGTPTWQGSVLLTYDAQPWTINLQQRFMSGGLYSNIYTDGTGPNSIDYNHVDGVQYTDLTVTRSFEVSGHALQGYLTVNNLFDKDPPISPSRIGVPTTILQANPTLHDVMGRYFTVGLKFRL
jgi:outer membrane receptor protein involved in Fe transport